MANLSPFQRGYGSLQIFSLHQNVPSGEKYDYLLTGLRRDSVTAQAPGVFAEIPLGDVEEKTTIHQESVSGKRHPGKMR